MNALNVSACRVVFACLKEKPLRERDSYRNRKSIDICLQRVLYDNNNKKILFDN